MNLEKAVIKGPHLAQILLIQIVFYLFPLKLAQNEEGSCFGASLNMLVFSASSQYS